MSTSVVSGVDLSACPNCSGRKGSWELCTSQEARGGRFNDDQDFFFFAEKKVGWGL